MPGPQDKRHLHTEIKDSTPGLILTILLIDAGVGWWVHQRNGDCGLWQADSDLGEYSLILTPLALSDCTASFLVLYPQQHSDCLPLSPDSTHCL
ncbi:hypothetical protein EYF80_014422 [Liparis tanakae]|uniref:Uncharacterized protein n=1 Tax=Liparis tanakae TaxID=230148 RepID=A0A4Z2ID01_9TELE|nr:hypothetical protein EYF80_014422 [Liparis tanakae]